MPTKLFDRLNDEKRARIRDAALGEFSRYTYTESSTNRIVEAAGIAKGSLFKYFVNKRDLYFYVLDSIVRAFSASLEEGLRGVRGDMFERTARYAAFEFSWYIHNPLQYGVLIKAPASADADISKEMIRKYAAFGDRVFYKLFEDMDAGGLRRDMEKRLNILKWFLQGFNEAFVRETHARDDIEELSGEYLKRLNGYLAILKEGLQ